MRISTSKSWVFYYRRAIQVPPQRPWYAMDHNRLACHEPWLSVLPWVMTDSHVISQDRLSFYEPMTVCPANNHDRLSCHEPWPVCSAVSHDRQSCHKSWPSVLQYSKSWPFHKSWPSVLPWVTTVSHDRHELSRTNLKRPDSRPARLHETSMNYRISLNILYICA